MKINDIDDICEYLQIEATKGVRYVLNAGEYPKKNLVDATVEAYFPYLIMFRSMKDSGFDIRSLDDRDLFINTIYKYSNSGKYSRPPKFDVFKVVPSTPPVKQDINGKYVGVFTTNINEIQGDTVESFKDDLLRGIDQYLADTPGGDVVDITFDSGVLTVSKKVVGKDLPSEQYNNLKLYNDWCDYYRWNEGYLLNSIIKYNDSTLYQAVLIIKTKENR